MSPASTLTTSHYLDAISAQDKITGTKIETVLIVPNVSESMAAYAFDAVAKTLLGVVDLGLSLQTRRPSLISLRENPELALELKACCPTNPYLLFLDEFAPVRARSVHNTLPLSLPVLLSDLKAIDKTPLLSRVCSLEGQWRLQVPGLHPSMIIFDSALNHLELCLVLFANQKDEPQFWYQLHYYELFIPTLDLLISLKWENDIQQLQDKILDKKSIEYYRQLVTASILSKKVKSF